MSRKLLGTCIMAFMLAVDMSAYALEKVNGVYQIGTAEDFAEFAALVNGGEKRANAILTADIDLGTNIDTYKLYNGEYLGSFDGAGHTITINFSDGTKDDQGPAIFRSVGNQALIKRLKVQGTITTSRQHAAGIANYSGGVIRDCWADVTIKCPTAMTDASAAAFVGQCNKNSLIENSVAKIAIDAVGSGRFGGVAAWADADRCHIANCLVINDNCNFDRSDGKSAGLVRNDAKLVVVDLDTYNADSYHNRPAGAVANNYVVDNFGGENKGTTVITTADIESGKICFQLNSDQKQIRWKQNLGTDPYPVPAVFRSEGQVYASASTNCQGKAEGEVTYSNTPNNSIATAHTYDKYGVCTTCGQFNWNCFDFNDPERYDPADRSFLINSGDDLFLAEGWNRLQNGCKFNLKLTNDVECKPESGQLIFNSNDWIESNFNGQGHTLTIEMVDINEECAALFPRWYNVNGGAVIENLVLHGTINTNSRNAGSVFGRDYGSNNKVRNVFSDVTINTTHTGDCSHGGFFNCGGTNTTLENCIYAGEINGVEGSEAVGGFCGWASGGNSLINCAFIGKINNIGGDTQTIGRNKGVIRSSNVYSINSYGTDTDKYIKYENPDGVASGELAYFLNGKQEGVERFYQSIGEDKCPLPIAKEGTLVYIDQFRCDGLPLTFSNTPRSSDPVIPDHQYDADGICTVCGELEKDADGYMKIINARTLAQFATLVNSGKTTINARLYDDIDYTEYSQGFIGVGNAFSGTFDGQGNTITIAFENNARIRGLFAGINGATIKNLVVDGGVTSAYNNIGGLGGQADGDNSIENVVVNAILAYSPGSGDASCGGFLPYINSGTSTFINCAFYGSMKVGSATGNAGLVGWSTGTCKAINCLVAPADVEAGSFDDYARGAKDISNCYKIEGDDMRLSSGEICFTLNGSQFRNPVWYQTIGEDEKPSPNPARGIVIGGAEQYFSVMSDDDIPNVASAIGSYEEGQASADSIATQTLLDEWKAVAEILSQTETLLALADAYDSLNVVKAAVEENMAVYKAYINKCAEINKFLEDDKTFSGSLRTALEAYLSEDGEPDEDNPLGTYVYIVENHVATAEEIEAEITRVDEWLKLAIAEDYVPGTDVSWLIPNSDFAKKNADSWTGAWCNAFADIKDGNGNVVVGVEGWNRSGDMYQTAEHMKPGYYLVGLSGAFRPSNNRYSTNYVAGVYANGIFNYFPTVIEDYIAVADAMDQINCNLNGEGALDVPVYSDFASTDETQATQAGASLLGYAVQGTYGMAIAASASRYQAYTIAYVGEDGKLTIGIKSQGTKYAEDWTGWGPIKVTYCGEEADEALGTVLENMKARAESIINYEVATDIQDPSATPNFPAELKASLVKAVNDIDAAEDVQAKAELAKQFSDLFQAVYDGKRAYADLYNLAIKIDAIEGGNLRLAEKDGAGEWFETGETVFGDDFFEASQDMLEAFVNGSYSTEEALNPALALTAKQAEAVATIIPEKDEEGYYLISNPKQFVAYRSLFLNGDYSIKAKLTEDIDMTGIAMQPFGNNTMGTDDKGINFNGVLDGQGHALDNVYIKYMGGRGCALFYELSNATVKNLKLTGEYYGDMQRMGGLTRYTSGATNIENCEIAVVLHNDIAGDATSGGITGCSRGGGNVYVTNCIVNCTIIAKNATSFGGVCGWRDGNLTLTNVLVLSQYDTAPEPDSYPTDMLSRNGCTVNNVYYAERSFVPGAIARGTAATDAQLASGEICYKLNGDKQDVNSVWFQTIGEDANPVLDKTHKMVIYDEVLGYHNPTKDEEDAIDNLIPTLSTGDGAIYNLAGQRVSKPQKGIFILNGKKVLFR